MPNCYCLFDNNFVGPRAPKASWVDVDEKMCAFFGAVPDAKHWYYNWENNFGIRLAMGDSWDTIKGLCLKENSEFGNKLFLIACWLEYHYTVDTWVETGRRR